MRFPRRDKLALDYGLYDLVDEAARHRESFEPNFRLTAE